MFKRFSDDGGELVKKGEDRKNEIPLKKTLTAVIFFIHFAMGVASYTVGPTLIDLKVIYACEMNAVSLFFTSGAIGYIFGALFGFSYKYLNRQFMVAVFTILMGIGLAMIPHGHSLIALYSFGFIIGGGGGGLDSAQNVWMMEMWQEKSSPVLQAARFANGLGGIFSPAILKPFITGDVNQTLPNGTTVTNDEADRSDSLAIPYAINGLICLAGGVMMALLFLVNKYQKPEGLALKNKARPKSMITGKLSTAVTIFGAVFLAFYASMKVTFDQFMPTYSHYAPVHFTEQQGDSLMVALSTANVIAKFFFILVALRVPPQRILYFNYFIMIIAFSLMTFGRESPAAMWAAAIIFGIGQSALLPSIYAYLEQNLVMTNRKGALFTLVVGALSAAVPALLGQYIKDQPYLLIYISLVNILISIVAFIGIHFIVLLAKRQADRLVDKPDY